MVYDSTDDTLNHIERVQELIEEMTFNLSQRSIVHDESKLEEPEKSVFDRVVPRLKTLKYGSDEYQASLDDMGAALDHHYRHNDHHPQFFRNGINEMNLMNLAEMLADWKAGTERTKDGNIRESIAINRERFHMSDQLTQILLNTVDYLEW